MAYKMPPPSTTKTPKPDTAQKDLTAAAADQDQPRKDEPVAKTEEYGYIVTNQRCSMLVSSTWLNQSG